jgi:hypothetical protein
MQNWNKETYIKIFEENGIENYTIITENCILIFNTNSFQYNRQCLLQINPEKKEIELLEEKFSKYKTRKSSKMKFYKREVFRGDNAINEFCKYWIAMCNFKIKLNFKKNRRNFDA